MGTRSAAIQIRAPSVSASVTPSRPNPVPSNSSSATQPPIDAKNLSIHSADGKLSTDTQHESEKLSIHPSIFQNVLLNGSYKNEKEGTYDQSHQPSLITGNGGKSSPSSPRKFSLPILSRTATAASTGFPSASLTTSAPVFIPGSTINHQNVSKTGSPAKLNMAAAEFEPSGLTHSEPNTMYTHSSSSDPQSSFQSTSSTSFAVDPQFQARNPYAYNTDPLHHHESHSFNDSYLGHSRIAAPSLSNFQRPLNYHLYAPPLPHSSNQHPDQLLSNSFFMPASIHETLQKKSAAILQGPTHEVARSPEDLEVYHSLVVIDSPHSNPNSAISHTPIPSTAIKSTISFSHHQTNPISTFRGPYFSKIFKNPSWIYKAFCNLDGKAYCLYRIEGFQLNQRHGEAAIGQVERWRMIRHPSIVNIREAFTTRAFGDQSIAFAFDYHPLSHSLYDEHISSSRKKSVFVSASNASLENETSNRGNFNSNSQYSNNRSVNGHSKRSSLLSEKIIWSYVMQIANAIKTVHLANLAVRTIDSTKILLTGPNRVRINGCGILDVLEYSPTQSVEDLQREDLRDLGNLICSIASSSDCSKSNPNAITQGLEYVKQFYSKEMKGVVDYLIDSTADATIDGLLGMVFHKSFEELARAFNHNDLLEECLARELENGRLVRLMTKLGFINERPEFDHDPSWSETSERYLLKLFRDYVFHQVDSVGKPVIDLSHVLTCLNKLDAGLDERITLISRDDQTCAVVSYAEIKRILDSAFRDLSR
ncbi:hypothetical protein PPACK8108_LOCUS6464 [Phakopsora pachyrhizi]|uniref:PAN2-PAN3 deadenylation complex subunit PAN3 n=1 Tax=Phakopsora pachyrhizi TaxID=170000 RepID=A0AAV0AR46_PHAPC|nr:hypothetical protein PPACK8108_LOCUS6464 [Phakopsora pachyrhizi]